MNAAAAEPVLQQLDFDELGPLREVVPISPRFRAITATAVSCCPAAFDRIHVGRTVSKNEVEAR